MLKNNLKSSPKPTKSDIIPDPWETSPVLDSVEPSTTFPTTSVKMEEQPLIRAAGNPDALLITPPKFPPEQTLLGDWLKLQAKATEKLAMGVRQALGLLYLLESPA